MQEGSTWVSHRTEVEYDEHGLRRFERTHVRAICSANPNSAESTATFTRYTSQAPEMTFHYDVFGNLKKTTFADGSFISADYDDFDRERKTEIKRGRSSLLGRCPPGHLATSNH
jgi:hypothetical protein